MIPLTKQYLIIGIVLVAVAIIVICVVSPGIAGGMGFETAKYANVNANVHRPQAVGGWGVSINTITYETKTVWTTWGIGSIALWFWETFEGTLEVESLKGGTRVDTASTTFSITEWAVGGKDYTLQVKLGAEGSGQYTIIARALDKQGALVGKDQRVVTI